MVMLLPNGFEGQGPEHSYGYLDRFLSLCAEDNLQVCVPTRPSQHFHALRRQIMRAFRKPAIMMMPKSLLRYPPSWSKLSELTEGGFQLVLDDPANPERDAVKRILFCSGKVFYSLATARDKACLKNVAIVRVEQLYPFPKKEIAGDSSRGTGRARENLLGAGRAAQSRRLAVYGRSPAGHAPRPGGPQLLWPRRSRQPRDRLVQSPRTRRG